MTPRWATAPAAEPAPFPPRRNAPRKRPAPMLRLGITAKLGLLSGGLILLLVVTVAAVLAQARQTTHEYDRLLTAQVDDALAARRIQVEFKRQVQEWKDVLLRGSKPDDLTTYTANFRKEDDLVRSLTDDLITRTGNARVRTDMTTFRAQHDRLDAGYERALTGFVASGGRDFAAADRLVRGQDRPPTTLLDGLVTHLSDDVSTRIAQQKSTATRRQRLGLTATLILLLVLAVGVTVVVRRLVRPIRELTAGARRVADDTLPAAISEIKSKPTEAEPPTLPAFVVRTRDELNDLADAFTQVQDSAVRLATEQHRAEREAAEMLVNLGRRNQNLLSRLLSQVSELERTEQDPEVLAQLFRLDHAATRIRRNAESMLVLAGASQTRTFSVPVPFEDAIRAALSEIEDYVRVDLYHIEAGTISGSAAADLVHLLAELIENATHFSPPHTQVTVVGQRIREGYRIRVIDQGIGMTQRELSDANGRILRATPGWADTRLLGLYVVGRLAARRGIEVTLEPSTARGITASVVIPTGTMADGIPESVMADGPDRGAFVPPPQLPTAAADPAPPIANPAPPIATADPAPPITNPAPPIATASPAPPAPQSRSTVADPTRPVDPVPAMPKRVRGAQLAGLDLGGADPQGDFAPAPEWSRWNLRSFQLDVEAARQVIAEQRDAPVFGPVPEPDVDLSVHQPVRQPVRQLRHDQNPEDR